MNNIIKYRRFKFNGCEKELQLKFDELIKDGYILFSYQEMEVSCRVPDDKIHAILICYKQNNINNILND